MCLFQVTSNPKSNLWIILHMTYGHVAVMTKQSTNSSRAVVMIHYGLMIVPFVTRFWTTRHFLENATTPKALSALIC